MKQTKGQRQETMKGEIVETLEVIERATAKDARRAGSLYAGLVAKTAIAKKRGYSMKRRAKIEIARARALATVRDLQGGGE